MVADAYRRTVDCCGFKLKHVAKGIIVDGTAGDNAGGHIADGIGCTPIHVRITAISQAAAAAYEALRRVLRHLSNACFLG
jgi:hypothetical protein